MTGQLVRL